MNDGVFKRRQYLLSRNRGDDIVNLKLKEFKKQCYPHYQENEGVDFISVRQLTS